MQENLGIREETQSDVVGRKIPWSGALKMNPKGGEQETIVPPLPVKNPQAKVALDSILSGSLPPPLLLRAVECEREEEERRRVSWHDSFLS